jgi:DNA-binding MarR family transcriptional regulator
MDDRFSACRGTYRVIYRIDDKAWAVTEVDVAHRRDVSAAPQRGPAMITDELDPLIHVPTRLKIVATLAALPDGDTLSFTRLQDLIGLTPGNLIIHLRKFEDADYISSEKTRNGTVSITTVALTGHGRAALGTYTQALRDLLGGL